MPVDIPDKKRTKRVKPCQRCKTLRRKCDRPSATEPCLRCRKHKQDCLNDGGPKETEDDSIDGNFDLQQLSLEVASLKNSLQHMERTLQQGRPAMTTTTTPVTATTDTKPDLSSWNPWEQHDSTTEQDQHTYSFYINSDPLSSSLQLSPLTAYSSAPSSSLSTCSNNSSQNSTTNEDEDYQWDLTLVNGKLQLETPILTLNELLAYGNALQRYLSPFAGVFDNTSFLFEMTQPQSLVPMVIQVVSWAPASSLGYVRNNTSMMDKYRFVLKRHDPAVLLAANNKEPPISCIDDLVHHFLICLNILMPMVHGSSFRAEYETLVRLNPTQHVLTMAICAAMCTSTCTHIPYDVYERRILADYFYQRAIDLLGNSFDDPDKRLETVIAINILSHYQQMTLRMAEGRKWCAIGFMIMKDLQREYKSHPDWPSSTTSTETVTKDNDIGSPDSTTTYHSSSPPPPSSHGMPSTSGSESLILADLAPITTDKNLALFSRHYIMSIFNQKFCDLILDHNPLLRETLDSQPIFYIEDEDELTRSFIGVYNKGLQLIIHPVVVGLKEQMQRMHLGEKAKVTLELILRFDQVYRDWCQSLPPHFRLWDQDPLDISCRSLAAKCRDPVKLFVYIVALTQKVEANLTVAKPSNQSAISQGGTYELVRAIQERALNEAFECTESLMVAIRNLEANKLHCVFSSDMLITLSDLLCRLAASSSPSVKKGAKQNLMETLRELRQSKFMKGNLVPPGLSPLQLLDTHNTASLSSASNELSQDIMEMYSDYTIPCFAFGYDILRKASLDSDVQ
ncbi:hypothetical protein BCR42DRAFT_490964 [Absidia repens]|uniref:Zn(2)-C6 fungal-type domain-containing protein n=1 Tax=Absidia repens TaxID=90262 RepID=A0A1X2II42_9FUNG|nr:hypothetical protein BCR42DRAFT_490964 [Absidia repens]